MYPSAHYSQDLFYDVSEQLTSTHIMRAGLDKLEVAIARSSLFMCNGGIVTCRHVVYTGVKMAGHWPTSSGSNGRILFWAVHLMRNCLPSQGSGHT